MLEEGFFHSTIKDFQKKDLNEFYVSYFFRSIGLSLINVFIPIYLYTLGFEISEICLFYLVFYSTTTILMPFAMVLNYKIGLKINMVLGTLFSILFFYLLNFLESGLFFYLTAIIKGLSVSLYFSAFHIEFSSLIQKRKEASSFSILKIITIISSILAPLIGSILIFKTSFNFLFFSVIFFLFLSFVPLIFIRKVKINEYKLSLKKILKADNSQKAIAYQSSAILGVVSGIFWPLFIYMNVEKIVSLGGIVSLSSFAMLFFIYYLGKASDKNNSKMLKLGVFLHAPSWLFRVFLLSPFGLFFSNFFSSATSSIISISFSKLIYSKASKSKNIADYFLFREFYLGLGRSIILAMAIFMNNLYWMFVFAFFASFPYLILANQKNKKLNL